MKTLCTIFCGHTGRNRRWRHPRAAIRTENIPKPNTSFVCATMLRKKTKLLSFGKLNDIVNVGLTFFFF